MPLPSLLVSVRSLAETRAAIDGGCDRLDVKEPIRGALGMADAGVMAEIAAFSDESDDSRSTIPCSVALGEIDEWREMDGPFALPRGVCDIKLGPAGLRTIERWVHGWQDAIERFRSTEAQPIRPVAVAYADWQAADAPRPDEILAAAINFGMETFLIDTGRKGTGSLLDALSSRELGQLSDAAHSAGLTLALAGSLRMEDIAALVELRPDVIAVRGAACEGGRSGVVSSACVRRLKAAICASFEPGPKASLHA